MGLTPGTRLGPYEITAQLGAGGMGEVYKATDTRLGRTVAVKVLPDRVAADPALQARFEREARALSSLNHPHICTIHDVGREQGVSFLVMEYLEGETLAERISRGALPIDRALRHAVEIGDALDKAHRQGIVHRDLKPGNVMLTKAGAKLLDFGLAKLQPTPPPVTGLTAAPTVSTPLTGQGSIVGTFQYMAPEQLEGREADARTDIFAFGALLYEMVTGRKAFQGQSQASLIAAILERQPAQLVDLQPLSPPALERVVEGCLAKSPDDRWQSAHDVARQLRSITQGATESGTGPVVVPTPVWRRVLPWMAGTVAGVIVASVAAWLTSREPPRPPVRFTVDLPASPADSPADSPGASGFPLLAVSPDGRTLVVGQLSVTGRLLRRDLGQFSVREIQGPTGLTAFPFFSPDGQSVGYIGGTSNGTVLRRVALAGGPVSTIVTARNIRGASWGPDDTIVYSVLATGLWRVAATGAPAATQLTVRGQGEPPHWLPDVLPNGSGVLFTIWDGSMETSHVAVVPINGGEPRTLVDGSHGRFVPTGHIVFARTDSLWAVPFDQDRLEVTGDPVQVLDGVRVTDDGVSQVAISPAGTLAYVEALPAADSRRLGFIDQAGEVRLLNAPSRPYTEPVVSPDGTRIAVTVGSGDERDIYIWHLDTGILEQLTRNDVADDVPLWTPDGTRVVFASDRDGGGIFARAADGTGTVERLLDHRASPWAWTPDGRLLLSDSGRIAVLDVDGGGMTSTVLLDEPGGQSAPSVSPDGGWLAYESNQSGRSQIYVRPFPDVESGRVQVSPEGGSLPNWLPDGSGVVYGVDRPPFLEAIRVLDSSGGFSFEASPAFLSQLDPQSWPAAPAVLAGVLGGQRLYSLAAGPRFLTTFVTPPSDRDVSRLVVVVDWFDELRRLAPID